MLSSVVAYFAVKKVGARRLRVKEQAQLVTQQRHQHQSSYGHIHLSQNKQNMRVKAQCHVMKLDMRLAVWLISSWQII